MAFLRPPFFFLLRAAGCGSLTLNASSFLLGFVYGGDFFFFLPPFVLGSSSTTGFSLDLIRFLFVCFLTLLFKTFLLFQPVNQSVNGFTQSKRNQLSLD